MAGGSTACPYLNATSLFVIMSALRVHHGRPAPAMAKVSCIPSSSNLLKLPGWQVVCASTNPVAWINVSTDRPLSFIPMPFGTAKCGPKMRQPSWKNTSWAAGPSSGCVSPMSVSIPKVAPTGEKADLLKGHVTWVQAQCGLLPGFCGYPQF